MVKHVLCAVWLVAACGSKPKQDTMPEPTGDDNAHPAAVDESANMIPPEKMDEVTQALKRKEMIVSRCLANAMDAGEVKRGTHGRVTFEIVFDTSGKPSSVKVDRTDITEPKVVECAKKYVEDVQVSALPHSYETSYTFAMEAN